MDPYSILLLILILEFFALYSVKKSSVKDFRDSNLFLIFSMILYSVIPLLLYKILKQTNRIASLNTTWNVASTIYGLIIGAILFREVYTSTQLLGMILGIVAVCLINFTSYRTEL